MRTNLLKRWVAPFAVAAGIAAAGLISIDPAPVEATGAPGLASFQVIGEDGYAAHLDIVPNAEAVGSACNLLVDGAMAGGTVLAPGSNIVLVPQGGIYTAVGAGYEESRTGYNPDHDPGDH